MSDIQVPIQVGLVLMGRRGPEMLATATAIAEAMEATKDDDVADLAYALARIIVDAHRQQLRDQLREDAEAALQREAADFKARWNAVTDKTTLLELGLPVDASSNHQVVELMQKAGLTSFAIPAQAIGPALDSRLVEPREFLALFRLIRAIQLQAEQSASTQP